MQTEPTCQPDAASPPNSDLRPASSSRWKRWGSNCAAKRLIASAVNVNDPSSRRSPTAISSKKRISLATAPSRRRTMIGETITHSAWPAALRAAHLKVTMPVSGRLRDIRASTTSTSSIRSSPGRSGASQRISLTPGEPSEAVSADEAVEHHPHHDRAQMPAGAGQPLQHRARRRLFVEMHRLRIEFGGEREHFLARDMARTERAEAAGLKIFESQGHRSGLPEGSPIVAALCGNLNRVRVHGYATYCARSRSELGPAQELGLCRLLPGEKNVRIS